METEAEIQPTAPKRGARDKTSSSDGTKRTKVEKYNLRRSSIVRRIEVEERCRQPKESKPKNKPAPLSKYRRKSANARERGRMNDMNAGFEKLRDALPEFDDSKATKLTLLRLAMNYIQSLQDVLGYNESSGEDVGGSGFGSTGSGDSSSGSCGDLSADCTGDVNGIVLGETRAAIGALSSGSLYIVPAEELTGSSTYRRSGGESTGSATYRGSVEEPTVGSIYRGSVGESTGSATYRGSSGESTVGSLYRGSFGESTVGLIYRGSVGESIGNATYRGSVGNSTGNATYRGYVGEVTGSATCRGSGGESTGGSSYSGSSGDEASFSPVSDFIMSDVCSDDLMNLNLDELLP